MTNNFNIGFWLLALLPFLLLAQPSEPHPKNGQGFEHFFWEAQKFKVSDRSKEALLAFVKCDSIEPGNALILMEISKMHFKLKEIEPAVNYAQMAAEAEEAGFWHKQHLADLYIFLGDFNRAAEILESALATENGWNDAYFQLAGVYFESGQLDKGLAITEKIESLRGIDPEMSLQRKQIFLLRGELDKALQEIDKLIVAFPNDYAYALEKAEVLSANNREEDAFKLWNLVLKNHPQQAHAHLRLAKWHQQKKDFDKSYFHLKNALASPELGIDDKISVLLSYYQLTEKDPRLLPQAYELIHFTETSSPEDPKIYAMKGDFLLRENRSDEALTAYKKALSFSEGNKYEIWQQVLLIYAQKNMYDALLEAGPEVIETFPAQPFPYLVYGLALWQTKNLEKGAKTLNNGLNLTYGNKALEAEFHGYLAQVEYELKNIDKSFTHFEKAIKLQPDNALLLNNYAYYLAENKRDLQKALTMTEKSNRLEPNSDTYLDTWAWVLFRLDRFAEALEKIETALAQNQKPSGLLLEHKGDILFKLNRAAEAIDCWQKADLEGGGSVNLKKKLADGNWYE